MKIALVHDQLQEFGGAERVLVALKDIFPDADVFTAFYSPDKLGVHAEKTKAWKIHTSWVESVPGLKQLFSPFRFLTPLIWESFDFKGYDLVISSSGGHMCKGIITRPETKHISYLHHQPRYLYYYETAVEWQKYWPVKVYGHLINHKLRMWDYLSSQRVDHFIANSEETKRRISKFYRRDAEVIYPPVNIPSPAVVTGVHKTDHSKPYYITISRLARAKHIEILIEAANKTKFNLKIIGSGRDEAFLKQMAGPTVEFLGNLPDDKFDEIVTHAKAFLFASVDEEFGIAIVEAMGRGVPAIAFASGGVPEIIDDGKNGLLYRELSAESLSAAVKSYESVSSDKLAEFRTEARKKSEQFSYEIFKKNILKSIESITHARTS